MAEGGRRGGGGGHRGGGGFGRRGGRGGGAEVFDIVFVVAIDGDRSVGSVGGGVLLGIQSGIILGQVIGRILLGVKGCTLDGCPFPGNGIDECVWAADCYGC